MRLRAVQFFFAAGLLFIFGVPVRADLTVGQIYALNFTDVDGNKLSTASGYVTVIVLATPTDAAKARTVGDRVPEYCLGNPTYRMITVLNFQKKRSRLMRNIVTALVRRRLDAEAKRLQPRYTAKKIMRNPRRDVFAVADFDGTAVSQLGSIADSSVFRVFVFSRKGELLRRWNDVPSRDELAAVVK
jgi:hypothetical protein